jgi:hypothetical protein
LIIHHLFCYWLSIQQHYFIFSNKTSFAFSNCESIQFSTYPVKSIEISTSGFIHSSSTETPFGENHFQTVNLRDVPSSKSNSVCIDHFQNDCFQTTVAHCFSFNANVNISLELALSPSMRTTVGIFSNSQNHSDK